MLGVVLCVNVGGRAHGALFRRGRGPCGKVCGVCYFGPLQAKKIGLLGPFLNVSGAETSLDRRRIKFCVYWCTKNSKSI